MISSVTTTTIATIGTQTTTTAVLIAVCMMVLFLMCKDSVLTNTRIWSVRLQQLLTVSIVPLLIVFVLNAILQVTAVL